MGLKGDTDCGSGQPMTGPALDPCHKSEPTLTLPRTPGPRGWMAQKGKEEPNTIGGGNVNVMMLNNILLYSYIGA